ncbi:MAG: hypothetical protein MJZ03_02020 [archaeon]|nr:hypothetical protein [archaeon]
MRLVHIAGLPKSGKTQIIKRACNNHDFSYIANNFESAELMTGICKSLDLFPFKSPCARVKQYQYRVDLMAKKNPEIIVTEPPGTCMEVSAPMLNQIYVSEKDKISLGPLITAIDIKKIKNGISKRKSEELRLWNMIDESDAVIVTFCEDFKNRASVESMIKNVNSDVKIFFFSLNSDVSEITDLIFGHSTYSRPLYN